MRPTPFVSGWNLHHISNQLCHGFKNNKANFALEFQGEKMQSQRRAYLSTENFVSSTWWRQFRVDTFRISAAVSPWHITGVSMRLLNCAVFQAPNIIQTLSHSAVLCISTSSFYSTSTHSPIQESIPCALDGQSNRFLIEQHINIQLLQSIRSSMWIC